MKEFYCFTEELDGRKFLVFNKRNDVDGINYFINFYFGKQYLNWKLTGTKLTLKEHSFLFERIKINKDIVEL